jgi:hypothetical protein
MLHRYTTLHDPNSGAIQHNQLSYLSGLSVCLCVFLAFFMIPTVHLF